MATAKHTYSVRLAVEGGGKVKAELVQVGEAGDRSLKKIETSSGKASRGLVGLGERMKALGIGIRALGGALAGIATVGGLAALADRSISAADAIAKTADKIGVGVGALQELRYAAQLAGIEERTLDMALQRFTRRAAEAAKGTGEAKDALAQMGIVLRDQSGRIRATEDLLGDVAEAFKGIRDPAERVRLAFKLFDSEGVAMVNMLSGGANALETVRRRARDLGIVLEEDLVRNAERARDELDTLGKVISANLTRAVLDLAPVIADASGQLAALAKDAGVAYEQMKILAQGDTNFEGLSLRGTRAIVGELRDDVKALRAERDALGDSVIDDVQRRWIEWRLERKEGALRQWQAKLAWLQRDTGGRPAPTDSVTTPDTVETDTTAAGDRAKRLVAIEKDLQRQLFDLSHQGADRIRAEEERLVGELGDLATTDTTDKVKELIARAGAVRDARLAQLAATETDAASRRSAASDRIIEGLEAERRALALTDRARFVGEALRRLSAEATAEERLRVEELAATLYDEKQAHEAVRAAAETRDRQLEAGRRIKESLRSAEEAYAAEVAELNALLRAGAIDQEAHARASEEAYDRMLAASRDWSAGVVRALRDYGREAGDASRRFEDVTTSALRASEDAWVAWAQTGKLSVTDFFATLEEAALRAAYQMMVMKPLSGFLGKLIGNLDFDLFGGGGGSAVYAPSAPHNSAFGLLGHAHKGGMIGGPNAFEARPVPMAVFADAPRFHRGGTVGAGEVPIIAKEGEVVGWPAQLRRAFGSDVVVQIIDQRSSGTPPEVSHERGPGGREVIRVLIREEVGRGIAHGWWDRSLGSAFGLNRRGVAR